MSEPKKLKIKSASSGKSNKLIMKKGAGAKGLKIKKSLPDLQETPDPQDNSTAAPKSLKIKSSSGSQNTQSPDPQQGLSIKVPKPSPQPEAKVDLNATLAPENRKAPPPMPAGYAPPPPQQANHSQGPIFPTQQPQQGQQQPLAYGTQQPAANPQGPIFPTQQPQQAVQQPPGTMPPPVHRKKTSAPLSAIMGEVKAARRITPEAKQEPQQEVVKVKKPSPYVNDSLGNEYCIVKEGTYYCGMDNEIVTLNVPFTIARFPVTKKDYFDYLKSSDAEYSSEELNKINKISPYQNSPAVMISWEDAKDYCRWLRKKTGEYYALPSINEWEMAARGRDGRVYPWGEETPNSEVCCFFDGYIEPQSTATVNYFANNVSPVGCVGMVGNVMEWTLDSFDDERDPHILKGGGWVSPLDFCNNITPCMAYPPTKRQEYAGFRLLYLPKDMYQDYRENLLNG